MILFLYGMYGVTFLILMHHIVLRLCRLHVFIRKNKKVSLQRPSTSVIICARNEVSNIRKNLPPILEQDYPDFEVIVVDDASTDGTMEELRSMHSRFPNRLRIIRIPPENKKQSGKKQALNLGIDAAIGSVLLLTDADCRPESNLWITNMVQTLSQKVNIVLGYGPYEKTEGLLNRFIRFDTFMIAVQYGSFALSGISYMGVGRNLLYRKDWFLGTDRFASHEDLASGDDDLLISKYAGKNVSIEFSPKARMWSAPPLSFREFLSQKRRHISTATRYPTKIQVNLIILEGAQVLFHLLLFALLSLGEFEIPLIIYTVFLFSLMLFLYSFDKKFGAIGKPFLFPFLIWLRVGFNILLLIAGKRPRNAW